MLYHGWCDAGTRGRLQAWWAEGSITWPMNMDRQLMHMESCGETSRMAESACTTKQTHAMGLVGELGRCTTLPETVAY